MKYFTMGEFRCKHCGQLPENGMDSKLLQVLEKMRERLGEPLIVSSGYRCPTHNRNIGGASQSYHMRGKAADVYIRSERFTPKSIEKIAFECGADTACAYEADGFCHVDMRGYREEGWV